MTRSRADYKDNQIRSTRSSRYLALISAALVMAVTLPTTTQSECHLENVATPQEIAGGWTIHEDHRIVKQVDSAPYEQGGRGNWFIDRETTTLPFCSVFDDLGGYSLRSYMLPPYVTKSQVKICQATADGGSVRFVPADARPKPADTAHEVYLPYDRPYSGPCPPATRAQSPTSKLK